MKTYVVTSDIVPENMCFSADVSDGEFTVTVSFSSDDGEEARTASISVTAGEIAAREDLDDNEHYVWPFDAEGCAFLPPVSLNRLAEANGTSTAEAFRSLGLPCWVRLFVPFSADMVSFADCSLGINAHSMERVECSGGVEARQRFSLRGEHWYYPQLTGPASVKAGESAAYSILPMFRGMPANRPCKIAVSASHGTLSETEFATTGRRDVTLDTKGVPPGTFIALESRSVVGVDLNVAKIRLVVAVE